MAFEVQSLPITNPKVKSRPKKNSKFSQEELEDVSIYDQYPLGTYVGFMWVLFVAVGGYEAVRIRQC